jgi:outer membrane immunogenic protein
MKKLLLATTILGFAAPAMAADLPARVARPAPVEAVPVAVYNWSGFYFGGQIGGAWSESRYTLAQAPGTEAFEHDPSSWFGGGHVGLQGQWGSWVLGIEGTYSATNLKSTVTGVVLAGRLRTLDIDGVASVVGKLGFAGGNWLLYAKGGLALADIDTFAINPATGVNGSTSGWKTGWTVGGGIDYLITPNWIIGVDANYYRFSFDRSGTFSDGTPFQYTGTRSEIISATARLSYKFGGFGGGPVVARY